MRPYRENKFSFRFDTCIFLGYSIKNKGYLCFNLENEKIIISRDVIFHEDVFSIAREVGKKYQNSSS